MHTPAAKVDLESYREAAGVSWTELSRMTGITRESLRRNWSRPEEFKWSQLRRILIALRVPQSQWVGVAA